MYLLQIFVEFSGAGVIDDRAVIGAAVVCNPAMGHLLLARLASGMTELVNVRVRHGQVWGTLCYVLGTTFLVGVLL